MSELRRYPRAHVMQCEFLRNALGYVTDTDGFLSCYVYYHYPDLRYSSLRSVLARTPVIMTIPRLEGQSVPSSVSGFISKYAMIVSFSWFQSSSLGHGVSCLPYPNHPGLVSILSASFPLPASFPGSWQHASDTWSLMSEFRVRWKLDSVSCLVISSCVIPRRRQCG